MIIETSSGHIYKVQDNPATPHAWLGIAVKAVSKGNGWTPKAKARPILIRKEATRVIAL